MVTYKEKQRLRMIYKRYKCGLITESQLSDTDRELLIKYYGVKEID